MEKMKEIKNMLVDKIYEHMGDLDYLETEELGEVIDMIKDLSKSIYHCTIVDAMEHGHCESTADLCSFVKLKLGSSDSALRMQALNNYLNALTKDLMGITADEKKLIVDRINKI